MFAKLKNWTLKQLKQKQTQKAYVKIWDSSTNSMTNLTKKQKALRTECAIKEEVNRKNYRAMIRAQKRK